VPWLAPVVNRASNLRSKRKHAESSCQLALVSGKHFEFAIADRGRVLKRLPTIELGEYMVDWDEFVVQMSSRTWIITVDLSG
jgi:hypothetical protein